MEKTKKEKRDEILKSLKDIKNKKTDDLEIDHVEADTLLLELIDDEEITDAFWAIDKWYS